jgi:two-component system response regulator FixJ
MTRHIYIVDDEEHVRASLHGLLGRIDGFAIRSFPSGTAFLEVADSLTPGVLLLDMHMPGASGLDVLHAIAGRRPGFAAIVITGSGDLRLAVDSMRAGAVDFIEKPVDNAELLALINRCFVRFEEDIAATTREREARERIAALSPRERDVLDGLIEGSPNKVIAANLGISPRTIEIYRSNLMLKLRASNLSDVLRTACLAGVIEPYPPQNSLDPDSV